MHHGGQLWQLKGHWTGRVAFAIDFHSLLKPTWPQNRPETSLPGGELAASTHSMAQEMVRALETIAMRGCALVGNLAPCVPSGSKASQHVYAYVYVYDM